MIAKSSAVNMDVESDNLVEITVSDGKTVAQQNSVCIHGNVIR